MAIDISTELNNIKSATYGEQVRGSIHDGIQKIANSVNTMETSLNSTLSTGMTNLNNRANTIESNLNTRANTIESTLDTKYQAVKDEVDASDPLVVRKGIAPMYDSSNSSTVYNVGDYVYHSDPNDATADALYKCQTATTGGTWNSSCWIKATFGEDLSKRVEVNQFRFDSATATILAGKSCNDLVNPGVWYVNKISGVSTLTDFPIDGPGWIRVTVTNANRLMQEVYPSDIDTYPYCLFRTKNVRVVDGASVTTWTDWYKIPLIPEDGNNFKHLLAPEFSDQSTYATGSYALKNGVLYRFTQSHTGVWTGTDVEAVTVGSELIEVKTVLNNNLNCTKTTGFTIGKHIVSAGNIGDIPTLSEVTNGNFHSKIIECNEGDIFSITGSGGHTPRLWTFVDENGMILGNSAGGAVANNLILVAPKCANRLIINFDISLNPTPSLYAGESIDDRVKNKLYAETYYSEVSYTKSRNYDTDCYFVTIPKVTNNNCVIGISIEKDNNRSPLERAQYNGSTVTINCGMALKQLNETNAIGNIIGNGVVLNSNNIDISQTVPNSVGYLTIARDRSFKTYTIDTTLAELEQDGVENCFTFYYPLVLNDTIQSFDSVICNEDGVALVRHPRSAIGIKSDGAIVLFSCDGRDKHNLGLSSSAVATVLKAKGCSNAWMLDGGGSSSLVYHGEKMNRNMDEYGTVDRLITTTFNVTSPSKLKSINSLQTSVGSAKQRLIQQIMPSITGTKNEVNEFMELLGFVKLEYSYGFINAYYSTIDITKVNYTASYQYILQPCSAGDVFYVTGRGTYAALVWAFIDESGNSLTKANENDDLKNHRIVAPANTAYVLIQANDSYDHAAYMKIDGVI